MFQVGQKVVYGIHGVCSIVGLEEKRIDGKRLTYLALEPVGQAGSRFLVPTHNTSAMAKLRPLISRDALEALVSSQAIRCESWIQDENQRKQAYRALISSGDLPRLLNMVYTLYRHKAAQNAAGKRCHLCDENFLRDAEKLLAGVTAIIMELEPEAARAYIREKLK